MDPVSFVNSLELADITSEYALASKDKLSKLADNKSEGYVDAGSLVSFTEKLTGQNKQDVLNSTLLAQLAATVKYDRSTQTEKWFQEYMRVLQGVGWDVGDFTFTEYDSTKDSFEVSTVVIELLLALIGDEEPALMDIAKKTLQALKDSSSEAIKLFGSNSSSTKSGTFQIVPCTLDKSGQISVGFLGCYFNASKVEQNFLFFTYKKSDIKLNKSTDIFTLDEEVYAQVREEIVEKLGDKAKTFVKNLKI